MRVKSRVTHSQVTVSEDDDVDERIPAIAFGNNFMKYTLSVNITYWLHLTNVYLISCFPLAQDYPYNPQKNSKCAFSLLLRYYRLKLSLHYLIADSDHIRTENTTHDN